MPALAPATAALNLDVFPAMPADLRARARGRAVTSRLPGGVVLEELPEGVSYQLDLAGGWRGTQTGGGWSFRHPDGAEVVLGADGFTLRIPG